jgi:hypothetical protein
MAVAPAVVGIIPKHGGNDNSECDEYHDVDDDDDDGDDADDDDAGENDDDEDYNDHDADEERPRQGSTSHAHRCGSF